MNYKTIYRSVLLLSIIAALIAGVFMAVSLGSSSDDSGLNVYNSENVKYFELVSNIFIICCAIYIIVAFSLGRRVSKNINFQSKMSRYAYGGMGVVLSALAVFNLVREFTASNTNADSANNMYVLFETLGNSTKLSPLFLSFTLALIGSAAFFFYAAFSEKTEGDGFACISLIPSLALVVKTIYDFLLQSTNGYGSLYNYHLLGLGFVLLFAVNEARFYFKKGAPALYIFFGITGAMASVIFSVSTFTLFFQGKAGANWHPAFCAADIAIAVYIYIRLFSLNVRDFTKHTEDDVLAQAFNTENDTAVEYRQEEKEEF